MYKYFILIMALISCGDPLDYFYEEIERNGYHSYPSPMEETGTGTIISGNSRVINLIASSRTCFPSQRSKPLRGYDEVTFPTKTKFLTVTSDLKLKFLRNLGNSSPSLKAGVRIKEVNKIEFKAEGIHVEHLNVPHVLEYYMNKMSSLCRPFILGENLSFVSQVVKVDRMEFIFYSSSQGRIEIDSENINQYLDFSGDIRWKVDKNFKLIIETPKYIAYQLSRIREDEEGVSYYQTNSTGFDEWSFEKIVTIQRGEDISVYDDILKYQPYIEGEDDAEIFK